MNITEKFKKPYWVRKVAGGVNTVKKPVSVNSKYYTYPAGKARPDEIYLTEEDFVREIKQSAHSQMSDFQSRCPVWKPDTTDGKWKVDHFDDIEVTTLGIQKQGGNKFVSHMSGKGFGIACEKKFRGDTFDKLCSWRDIVGISTTAFTEICQSLAYTCEALIYQYKTPDGDIDYEVFSYLKGDMIFVHTDEKRHPVYYRKYLLKGKTAVDIYSTTNVQTWVELGDAEDGTWWQNVKSWFNRVKGSMVGSISEDGYTCVYDTPTQTPDGVNPCAYFRFPDLRSGDEQLAIESLERATSMVAEEYKEDAFPDFFVKAEKIVSLPPRGKFGRRTYGVKGTADQIKNADAHFIAPADASNIATLNINTKWDDIKSSMQMVFINPEILKSGADSSTTIKILFTPELQYCQLMWIYLFKPLKHMMNVFKTLVGLVENEPEAFNNLRISIYPDFWIPNNTAEEVDNTCKLVYASILSQEDGRSELGVQYLDSANRISKENADLLYQKTFVPLKAKYEAEQQFGVDNNTGSSTESLVIEENTDDNPYKTGVDNNAVRKNIIEDD